MSDDTNPKLTFAPAWDIILHNSHLSTAERMVLIEVCRYWPRAYFGSNMTISNNTGLSQRQVQRVLKDLSTGPTKRLGQGKSKRRAYIDRGYAHVRVRGKRYTSRLIYPLFMPGKCIAPDVPDDLHFSN